jgi:hypothetical protein
MGVRMKHLMLLISLLLLGACATNTIPNVEICLDEEMPLTDLGAFCKFTRPPNAQRNLTRAQWDAIRFGRFSLDAKALGQYQAFVKTACNQDQNCQDEAAQYGNLLNGMNAQAAKDKNAAALRLKEPPKALKLPPPPAPEKYHPPAWINPTHDKNTD